MKALCDKVFIDLSGREAYENKLRVFYQMRYEGLQRRNKPYPGANNLHYALIDEQINKQLPFFYNQIFQQEHLAQFAAKTSVAPDVMTTAAAFFDSQLREESNFEMAVLEALDIMLETARGILRVRWDYDLDQLEFEAIHPLYLVVPSTAKSLHDAPHFTHVRHLHEIDFRNDKVYDNRSDNDLIKRIKGDWHQRNDGNIEQERERREGLTYSHNKDTIIVWETWKRTAKGWTVHTYSPAEPDTPLRPTFELDLTWQGKPLLPWACFQMEVTNGSWYAARGIAEKLAPAEKWLCKNWNAKADHLDFSARPLFKNSMDEQTNPGAIRFAPGEVLPRGLEPTQMPPPPMAIDQEMAQTRIYAEQRAQMPDFGASNRFDGKQDNKTATEIQAITQLSSQGIDLRGRICRKELSRIYRIAWAFLLKRRQAGMTYYVSSEAKVLPQQAMIDQVNIYPSGNTDTWNAQMRIQKAGNRLQLLRNDPGINQHELKRDFLEADDPKLAKRLLIDNGVAQADAAEEQAKEIVLMNEGFPVRVNPADDHTVHIQTIMQYFAAKDAQGAPINPQGQILLQQHMQQHMQILQQQNPKAIGQIKQAMQAAMQQQAQPQGNGMALPPQPSRETIPNMGMGGAL